MFKTNLKIPQIPEIHCQTNCRPYNKCTQCSYRSLPSLPRTASTATRFYCRSFPCVMIPVYTVSGAKILLLSKRIMRPIHGTCVHQMVKYHYHTNRPFVHSLAHLLTLSSYLDKQIIHILCALIKYKQERPKNKSLFAQTQTQHSRRMRRKKITQLEIILPLMPVNTVCVHLCV